MGETVACLEDRPEPGQSAPAAALRADPGDPAPEAEQDQGGVGDGESGRPADAEPLGDEAGRQEDVVEAEDIFLERMGGLGEDEQEEGEAGAVPARGQRAGGTAASRAGGIDYRDLRCGIDVSIAGRPTGWVAARGMRCSSAASHAVLAPI